MNSRQATAIHQIATSMLYLDNEKKLLASRKLLYTRGCKYVTNPPRDFLLQWQDPQKRSYWLKQYTPGRTRPNVSEVIFELHFFQTWRKHHHTLDFVSCQSWAEILSTQWFVQRQVYTLKTAINRSCVFLTLLTHLTVNRFSSPFGSQCSIHLDRITISPTS